MSPITTIEAMAMLEMAFNEPPGSLRSDTSRENVAGWDSMGALMLMAELDERFGIVLTPEQSKTMTAISDVLGLLRSKNALTD